MDANERESETQHLFASIRVHSRLLHTVAGAGQGGTGFTRNRVSLDFVISLGFEIPSCSMQCNIQDQSLGLDPSDRFPGSRSRLDPSGASGEWRRASPE
jgi:hypothetical protein